MNESFDILPIRKMRSKKYGSLINDVQALNSHGDYCLYFYGKPDIQQERHRVSVNVKYHAKLKEGFRLKFRSVLADGNPAIAIYLSEIQKEGK